MNMRYKHARLSIYMLIFGTALCIGSQAWATPEDKLGSFLREKIRDTVQSIFQHTLWYTKFHTLSGGDPKQLNEITKVVEDGCKYADVLQQGATIFAPHAKKQYDHTNRCNDFKRAFAFYTKMSVSPFIQKRLVGNLEQHAVIASSSSELSRYESQALIIENSPVMEYEMSPSGHYSTTDSEGGPRILLLSRPPNNQDAQRLRNILSLREQYFAENGILKQITKK